MASDIKGIAESAGRALGTLVGTAAGVVAALIGKAPAPRIDPMSEEIYWREHYASEPYYDATFGFEDYLPAWRTGWEGRAKYAGRSFADAERELEADFHWNRGQSRLLWEQARAAVRAGFERTV